MVRADTPLTLYAQQRHNYDDVIAAAMKDGVSLLESRQSCESRGHTGPTDNQAYTRALIHSMVHKNTAFACALIVLKLVQPGWTVS